MLSFTTEVLYSSNEQVVFVTSTLTINARFPEASTTSWSSQSYHAPEQSALCIIDEDEAVPDA